MSKRRNDEMETDGLENGSTDKKIRIETASSDSPPSQQAEVEDIVAGITKVIDDAKVLLVANDEPSRSTTEQVRMNNLVCMLRNKLAEIDDVLDTKNVEEGEIEEGEIEDGDDEDIDDEEEDGDVLVCGPCDV